MKQFNYENTAYLKKLNSLPATYYSKYIACIQANLLSKNSKFLDVGFGSGTVLNILKSQGFKKRYGVDISRLFVKEGKKKDLGSLFFYDGVHLPFKTNYFNLVGSFNVLEHTEKPNEFLIEQIRVTKPGGSIIVACPNFLSVLFPNNHRRLKGLKNKSRNLYGILKKYIFSKEVRFEKMLPVITKHFEYDDDAIVVTNLIDLKLLFAKNNCNIIHISGFIHYDSSIFRCISALPFVKYLLPSCFIIAVKQK